MANINSKIINLAIFSPQWYLTDDEAAILGVRRSFEILRAGSDPALLVAVREGQLHKVAFETVL